MVRHRIPERTLGLKWEAKPSSRQALSRRLMAEPQIYRDAESHSAAVRRSEAVRMLARALSEVMSSTRPQRYPHRPQRAKAESMVGDRGKGRRRIVKKSVTGGAKAARWQRKSPPQLVAARGLMLVGATGFEPVTLSLLM